MAHKNRVWMRQRDVDDLGQDAGWCNVYSYEPAPPSREATLVIQESDKPQRVFTESEVRAMLRDLIEDQALCDVLNGWQSGMIPDFAGIASKHGVSIDPA